MPLRALMAVDGSLGASEAVVVARADVYLLHVLPRYHRVGLPVFHPDDSCKRLQTQARKVGLIFMGARRPRPVARMLPGSASHEVRRAAACPVVIAR